MAKNEVAVKQAAGAVAVFDYGTDGGAGFENQTSEDRSIPFLSVLQALSPQVEEKGLSAGMLFNTVTEETYDGSDGLIFVPSMTEHIYVEWVPRNQGGGFVNRYAADDSFVAKCKASAEEYGKIKTPEGNDLQETFYVYGVICPEDGDPELAVIAFTSTKIRTYRKYFGNKLGAFTLKQGDTKVRPPMFAHSVRIGTVKQENAKGKFYNFDLTPANGTVAESLLSPDDPRFKAAKECRDLVTAGTATAAVDSQGGDSEASSEDTHF